MPDETITIDITTEDKASAGIQKVGDSVKTTSAEIKGLNNSTMAYNVSNMSMLANMRGLERSLMTSTRLISKFRGEHDALTVGLTKASDAGQAFIAIGRSMQVMYRALQAATAAEAGAQIALNAAMTMGAFLVIIPAIIAAGLAVQQAFTAQEGADFIAKGDTSLMVHGGEHVKVTPALGGGHEASGSGYTIHNAYYIQGDMDSSTARRIEEHQRNEMFRAGIPVSNRGSH